MFRLNNIIRAGCIAAFLSVATSSMLTPIAHADPAPVTAEEKLPAGTVAVVNGVAITQSALDDAVKSVAARTGRPDTPQLRDAIKRQLIAREVLRQNAMKAHFNDMPAVLQAAAAAKESVMIAAYLEANVHPAAITDEQVRARYDELVASLGKKEYKPRVIATKDAADAWKALAALKHGQSFDAVAQQYSVIPSRTAGGAMPWVSFKLPVAEGHTQGLPFRLAQAISRLKPGGVTPQPVLADNMHLIVKLDAVRPTKALSFDEAKEALRKTLQVGEQRAASTRFVASQVQAATIQE